MTSSATAAGRPVTVYVTAQALGGLFALAGGWVLYAADEPLWGAAVFWIFGSLYLSRKHSPIEALGTGLQVGAVFVVVIPLAPSLSAVGSGADVSVVDLLATTFGPALVFAILAIVVYFVGLACKRRASRSRARRARRELRY